MSSDGQKMIVAKQGSDLHIICETSSNGEGVKWFMNEFTELASETGREMTKRRTTINGQLKTLHTLIIRNVSLMDTATYKCVFGSSSDEVDVKIVRLASKYILLQHLQQRRVGGKFCKC